ncbi:hypothetical protein ACWEQL_34025 [Kitasatospora sp. NPDC004240]
MTTPAPGPDGQSGQPYAPHFSVPAQQQPPAPNEYVAPGMPGAPTPYAYAPLPPQPARSPRTGAAIGAAVGAALVGALGYGFLMKALEREISYAAIGLAILIAFPLGKLGGRNPLLPVVGVVLSLVAVFLGQLFGLSLILSKLTGAPLGEIYGSYFSDLFSLWRESLNAKDLIFYGVGAVACFSVTKKVGAAD